MSQKIPVQPHRPSPSVAVIGLIGSGKTTLAATLANRLVTRDANGVSLEPRGHKTMVTIQNDWIKLQSREWPESTLQNAFIDLNWKMRIGKEISCDFRFVDVAGQDLLHIFSDDRCRTPDQFTPPQRTVFDYFQTADIVLFLLNLGDFIGEPDQKISVKYQAAMKSALDHVLNAGPRRRACIVLTQAELYKGAAQERGGWRKLLSEAVPFIYNAHLSDGRVKYIPVSAVFDTEIANDPVTGPRRVPTPGFRSVGLDVLMNWIVGHVREMWNADLHRVQPVPVVVSHQSEWKGRFTKTLVWTGVLRNDGAKGIMRVIVTALRDGHEIESRFYDTEIESGVSEPVTIRFTDTKEGDHGQDVQVRYQVQVVQAT